MLDFTKIKSNLLSILYPIAVKMSISTDTFYDKYIGNTAQTVTQSENNKSPDSHREGVHLSGDIRCQHLSFMLVLKSLFFSFQVIHRLEIKLVIYIEAAEPLVYRIVFNLAYLLVAFIRICVVCNGDTL